MSTDASAFGTSLPVPPRAGLQLTRKQRQVLTAIQRFSTLNGYMPSVRELGKQLGGLAPATVQHHLTSLRRKGFLEHDGAAHGVRLTSGRQQSAMSSTWPAASDAAIDTPADG